MNALDSILDELIANADRARFASRKARVKLAPLPPLMDPLTGQPWSEELIGALGTPAAAVLPNQPSPVALPQDRFAEMEERLHAASTLLAAAVHQLNGLSQVLRKAPGRPGQALQCGPATL